MAQRAGPFGLFLKRNPAEKRALARAFRVGAGGIALILLLMIIGVEYIWIAALLIGLALVAYGALALRRALRVNSWPTVEGRVLGTSLGEVVEPGRFSTYTYYYPVVRFEYATPRGTFTSERFAIAPADYRDMDPDVARARLEPYPAGARIRIHVNPRNHAVAVCCPHVSRHRRSHYAAALIAGLLVCALTAWSILP